MSGQSLPNISSSIKYFKDAFDWVEAHNSGRVVPHEGADEEYDFTCKAVKELESSLTKHLKEQRKLLGDASVRNISIYVFPPSMLNQLRMLIRALMILSR